MNLQNIQKLLQQVDISAYYLAATTESPISQLIIEVQTAQRETNHLEICEIQVPSSPVYLLQFFLQLPLPEPFEADDCIPDFLISDVHEYMAILNQMIPLPGFNCTDRKMYYRHIFATENTTQEQLQYIIETSSKLIQICQPSIQDIAIGITSLADAIEVLPTLFDIPEETNDK
jgi:hypothetical protein